MRPDWLAAIADAGSLGTIDAAFEAPRASPHLARWSIASQSDDGIRTARLAIDDVPFLAAMQDARYLGGSLGAAHAATLERLFITARNERCAVLLLCASGGVRLHEANPAEVAAARALRAMIDARAAGVPIVALCIADVFGGASVLACAADRLGMLPDARLGLSGPKVIATARGSAELDPQDSAALAELFGAPARAHAGHADLVAADADAVRAWVRAAIDARRSLREHVASEQLRLGTVLASMPGAMPAWQVPAAWREALVPIDDAGGLFRLRDNDVYLTAAPGDAPLGPRALHAQDQAMLAHVLPAAETQPTTLVLVEDSRGHEISRDAERACISRFLAHHACVLGVVRAAGARVHAMLAGQGHSAAFFVNALQADRLVAWRGARVMAMDPRAVARVTGLDGEKLVALSETDPVLGHAAPLLAAWGAVSALVPEIDRASLDALMR